ncbi:RNA polymerase sigma-70 factor [Bacteroides acidifaciens]|uniref:RNA polymerase sigma-70 factor n=1 Tax=Bacteroides acidifaciens TaxID=85831 RepID=UPI0025A9DA0E|nr:RNA polymerase sigma-70 factor [Bacteroides acidifaciens]
MMQKWQEELKKENEKAFSIIFNEYYSLLCAVSYQYVQDVQISEAVAEDVFFTLWEKRHEALPVSSLKAYLLKAVRNHSIDYLRTQKNEQFLDLESVTSRCFVREEDIFERYVMEELETMISEKIALLPEECQKVFYLSRYENKSYAEIAEELNISINTVKYHIKNALSTLRRELEPYLLLILSVYFSLFSK